MSDLRALIERANSIHEKIAAEDPQLRCGTSDLWPKEVKRVSSALHAGPYGEPILTPGYLEINGVRFYDDYVAVDQYGQLVICEGKMEIHQGRAERG